jgi:hypothetical protein
MSWAAQTHNPREQRRRWTVIGLSALAHLAILTLIGLNAPRSNFHPVDQQPPIVVSLLHLPSTPTVHHAASAPPSSASARAPVIGRAPIAPTLPNLHVPQRPAPGAPPSPLAAPSAPGAGQTPGAADKPGTSYAPGPEPYADAERGVGAFLRGTVGCDYGSAARLTKAEQTRCAERFGDAARKAAPFSGLDPLKRGRFDDQAAADEKKRQGREGPMTALVVPCSGAGSNFGTGCLPDASIMHIKPH